VFSVDFAHFQLLNL